MPIHNQKSVFMSLLVNPYEQLRISPSSMDFLSIKPIQRMTMRLQDRVLEFIENNGLSQADVARSISVSGSAISQWLKDKYKGDVKTLEEKLEKFMKNYNPKSADQDEFEVIQTANMQMSHFIINELIATKKIGTIYGRAGCGKTTMVKEFIKDHPEAILIEAVPRMRTSTVINEIGKHIGVQPNTDITSMVRDIAKALRRREAVLIIDEAENLNTTSLEAIRRIWDFSSVPTLLVGTYSLISNLQGRRGELLQLFSRVALKVEFSDPKEDEYIQLFGDVAPAISKVTKNMRIALNIFQTAKRFAGMKGQELNAGHVKAVLPMIMLDGGR